MIFFNGENDKGREMSKQWQIYFHYILPHHVISRVVGKMASCRCKRFKNAFIKFFINRYGVDMSEAVQQDYQTYPTFNDFFIRHLKEGARTYPVAQDAIASPVDGVVSEMGAITDGKLLQAKGRYFSVENLLGKDEEMASLFAKGAFMTAYLAPKDYHRIHMPIDGKLVKMTHVPGRLFSVNPNSVNMVDQLFARNERVVCLFETEVGPMAMIAVGAMIVASIATAWQGVITPPSGKAITVWDYGEEGVSLKRGEEMGYFNLGSTVILLFGEEAINWTPSIQANSELRLGEQIGLMSE